MKPLAIAGFAVAVLAVTAHAQEARTTGGDVLAKLLQQYDKDKDGKIQRSEYPRGDDAFANLDRDKNGVLDAADFAAPAQRPERAAIDKMRGDKPPKVGDDAPDFELPMLGMKGKTVKLSSFRGDQPVALIFGSYT